ncbi:MAG: YidC/Oxa1 family membrane protein insertase [Clostridia bacterium]|nr:YidC/Oxa1 family membrane protein insertase [Clostridia bacterium]
MNTLFNFINKPLGWLLESIAGLFGGNFAAAVFLFTLFINILLIPLSVKSQKSSVQQTRIKPKLDALKEKCGDDKQKYSMEMQKLYQEEGVSMSGGCLPMIFRLILMMSIYWLIMQPLTYLMHIDAEVIKEATTALGDAVKNGRASELTIIEAVKAGTIEFPEIASKLGTVDFGFFGIDLTQTPKFSFDVFHDAKPIWLMPIIAFAAQILSSLLSMKMQKKINPEAPSMAGMMLTMPLISLIIGFSLPGGVTFYWACSSLIGGLIQVGVQNFYGPHKMLSRERSKELNKQCDFEAGQIAKLGSADDE